MRDVLGWMPVAWSIYVVNLWAWHFRLYYDAALRVPWIHDLEHILVLFHCTGVLVAGVRPASRPAPVQHGTAIFYLFWPPHKMPCSPV